MNLSCNPRLSHGLTLIEMLVVLLIMGLLVSVTALSMGLTGRNDTDEAVRTAEDLSRLFEHAAQQALVKGEVLGWSLNNNANQPMQWWRWTSDSLANNTTNAVANNLTSAYWQRQPESFMPTLEVPAQLILQSTDLHTHVTASAPQNRQTDTGPAVVFLPGRESVPFELRVLDVQTQRSLARIWSTDQGYIAWSAL
ncbi:MAG: prepilin-type N-terminal cleavage/methylation domain-containing protein [Pseudohongiella sp.]|nr:prepilin-type N-terminal cleavage/methylation domain-containing protein [Pseudohongiella sp.]MDP2282969.1 prepilin-type N-terminal cleavage/methylation domain-containing protein [Pseudohongiella sp.]